MSASKILFYFCIAFVVGIFFESLIKIPQNFLWAFLIFAIILIIFGVIPAKAGIQSKITNPGFRVKPGMTVLGFCGLFLVLGVLRMQIAEFNIKSDKLSRFNDTKEIIVLSGTISNEPDLRDKSQKLKIKIDNFNSTVLVTTNRYPEYKYLDNIKLTGKLQTPSETEDFSYKDYLMKDRIYSVMNFPKVEKLDRRPTSIFSGIYSGILWVKQKLRQSIRQNFSPPESSILEGTILGDNGAMSDDLKNKLNATGLRHIIAVSGTHVVILSGIIMAALIAIGFWRGQAFYIALIFICLYIIFTGLPASGIRAGIMGGLYLLAQKLGRQSMGSRVIAMACAIMLFLNPLLLFYDIGFQLSFLAVMGLIYLEPFIRKFFKFLIKKFFKVEPKEKPESLLQMASTTLAAQIFTLPIMVFNFGNISFVSIITNLLVLPIVPALMIFGFFSSIAGPILNILGWILSIPTFCLLYYFNFVIEFFSRPWAMKVVQNVHWIWLLISYLAIGILTRFLHLKYRRSIV